MIFMNHSPPFGSWLNAAYYLLIERPKPTQAYGGREVVAVMGTPAGIDHPNPERISGIQDNSNNRLLRSGIRVTWPTLESFMTTTT